MKVQKEHKKSNLMHWTKKELVEHIVCLEHNYNVLYETFNNQYNNCLKLLDDMKLINDTYYDAKKIFKRCLNLQESEGENEKTLSN